VKTVSNAWKGPVVESAAPGFYAHLNWFDVGVLAVVLFSMVVGLVRGFFLQVTGILGVIASIFVALRYGPLVHEWLTRLSPDISPSAAVLVSSVGLFLAVWGAWLLLTHYLKKLMVRLDFGGIDRFLGGAFGLVKGALVAYVLLVVIHRFLPGEWAVNRELEASKANRGIVFFDGVLKQQKEHIPSAAWRIIAELRQFDDPTSHEEPGAKSVPES
jgi:membrane protein required for colicin V production